MMARVDALGKPAAGVVKVKMDDLMSSAQINRTS